MPGASSAVVVNTGPLIALGTCGELRLLPSLHERVVAPTAVLAKLERGGAKPQAPAGFPPFRLDWVEVLPLKQEPPPLLRAHLDEGEAAVIALALENGIPLVVVDERRGRMVARTMGLEVTGSVGVLLRAKRMGLLPAVRPCLEAMRSHGVWLSSRLVSFALQEAGEGPGGA